jgi:prevent-host-death family protein
MTTVAFTEFRRNASGLLSRVEKGEVLQVVRHGRPIAEITPIAQAELATPAWKKPALRLVTKGASLSAAITQDRADEHVL